MLNGIQCEINYNSELNLDEAKLYYIQRKQMDEKTFDSIYHIEEDNSY